MDQALRIARENLRAGRPLHEGIDAEQWQALLNRYSHFVDRRDADGFVVDSAVVVDNWHTPRPCLHLMASCHENDRGVWGSFWDQFGGGFSCLDSVLAGKMTSHLDTNYVPTAPEPQDCRGFYIHDAGKAWPMFPIAHFEEEAYSIGPPTYPSRATGDDRLEASPTCVQGLDHQTMRAERGGLECELEVCVHPELPLEVWRVRITNRDERRRGFSWFCRVRVNVDSFPSHYFVPRVVCEGLHEQDTLVFLNHDKANRHPRSAFFAATPEFAGFDMMGEVFDGIGGRSPIPATVANGRCHNSLGLQPYAGLVAAAQFDAWLEPGETGTWQCAYGACPYESAERTAFMSRVRNEVLSAKTYIPGDLQRIWERRVRTQMARTPDADLDRYYNVWSKYQARNQARFCRALDKVGYRDVLQDLLGVCEAEPRFVRQVLLRTLRYQTADGSAVRQYCLFPGVDHDLRMYMDSSSWIPDTLVQYVKETGDFTILDEAVPWFEEGGVRLSEPGSVSPVLAGGDSRTSAEGFHTGVEASVYEHAMQAVRSLGNSTGFHGLCRIGYGDWNDALSGIGGEQGVSVWLSCACVHAAGIMAGLAERLGRTQDAQQMRELAATMTQRINEHAWDGEWYVYAINGAGQPIGSRSSPEGRLHLNVNTWALFTGVAKAAGREEQVWRSLERLATPVGHVLIAPSYTNVSRDSVGRIADQKPGMFENGSIYTHGESFYLYALIAAGRGDACYRELIRGLSSAAVQDIATGPRQQQSNFTVGPDHPNFGSQLFSNFTGSVPWYRRVIERMLGVFADFDALVIDPRPPSGWDAYEVRKQWRGRDIRVRLRKSPSVPGTATPERRCEVTFNGRQYDGRIPVEDFSAESANVVDVVYGAE